MQTFAGVDVFKQQTKCFKNCDIWLSPKNTATCKDRSVQSQFPFLFQIHIHLTANPRRQTFLGVGVIRKISF